MSGSKRFVYAAALTPLASDLAPDVAALSGHCKWLLRNGCDGIGLLGTTGEANSFTIDERLNVIEGVVDAGVRPYHLMVGTGCCAISDTVRLTKAALDVGVTDILMLPPFYYKSVDDDGLYASISSVIEAVSDSRLKLYLYHFPTMTGLDLSLALVGKLYRSFPNTVVGMKDSSGDWTRMQRFLKEFPEFQLFSGTEKYLLACLEAGGAGTISATANLTSLACAEVCKAWNNGSESAPQLQEKLANVRSRLQGYQLVPALKEIMARHTGEMGWRRVRLPMMSLQPEIAETLWQCVIDSGLELPLALES